MDWNEVWKIVGLVAVGFCPVAIALILLAGSKRREEAFNKLWSLGPVPPPPRSPETISQETIERLRWQAVAELHDTRYTISQFSMSVSAPPPEQILEPEVEPKRMRVIRMGKKE